MLAGRQRAVAEVDLEAIRHNVRRLRRALPAAVVHCAVIKADGYGHGAVPVARAALGAGSTWLGVSTAAEAEELRTAGLTGPVLIFGPLTGVELERAARAGAEVVAWSEEFLDEAAHLGVRLHIKVDTGMHRLGVAPAEARSLCDRAAAAGALSGLMSHFATADEADTSFFELQLSRFAALATELKMRYPGLLCHAANSAATLRRPAAHFDMVRTGIAMYGLAPGNDDPFKDDLQPAMTLKSYVAGVRTLVPGDSVGYGRTYQATAPGRVAIVPIGYADGVRRALGNRADVLVAGRRCPIVGRISMDQMTVLLPDRWGEIGDEVVLFGVAGDGADRAGTSDAEGAAISDVILVNRDAADPAADAPRILCEETARLLGTINYEVACDVSSRVVRRYRSAAPIA